MLDVSSDFITAVNSNTRKLTARIIANFTDTLFDTTTQAESLPLNLITEAGEIIITESGIPIVTEGNENRVSRPYQVINGKVKTSFKYLTLDGSSFFDGTFHFAPNTEEADFTEIGWWGSEISDGSGLLPEGPGVRVTFQARRVTQYTVIGDTKRIEYPVDFTVNFYSGEALQLSEVVTGNIDVSYVKDLDFPINDIDRIELSITKWSLAETVPKITELSTAVIEEFDPSEIISFNVVEQREISNNNTIPTGNIASSEMQLTLSNDDRIFDAGNSASRLFGLVKPGVRMTISIGVWTGSQYEYIDLFTGWTRGWNVPLSGIEASTTLRDRIDLLSGTTMDDSPLVENETIGQWFVRVFSSAGLTNAEYIIDPVLYNSEYSIPVGWIDRVSHRKALTLISEGASTAVYQDRTGIIRVEAVDFFGSNNVEPVETYTESQYNDKDNQPAYETITNTIDINVNTFTKNLTQNVYTTSSSNPETIEGNTEKTFTVNFSTVPANNINPIISPPVSGVSIESSSFYSWGGFITVKNTNGTSKDFQFSITGDTFTLSSQRNIEVKDENSIFLNGIKAFSFPDNRFIQSNIMGNTIIINLLKSFKNPERDLNIFFDPGGNPALELGDRIGVDDRYGSKQFNVIKQEFNFNGGLAVKINGRFTGDIFFLITEDGNRIITEDGKYIITEG